MTTVTMSDGKTASTLVVPDGSKTYAVLLAENEALRAEVEALKAQVQSTWDIVEAVACGETLECPTCNKRKPCLCD